MKKSPKATTKRLTFATYSESCDRTTSITGWDLTNLAVDGIAGESGESVETVTEFSMLMRLIYLAGRIAAGAGKIADFWKKHTYHEVAFDRNHFLKELGDQLWYIDRAAKSVGSNLEEVAALNIAKCLARYPKGFSAQAATERRDEIA